MKWLRYRKTWAHGHDRWTYIPLFETDGSKAITNKEKLQTHVEDLYIRPKVEEYGWSDKFRGVEWDIILLRSVPNNQIEDTIKRMRRNAKYSRETAKRLNLQARILDPLKGKGRKTDPDIEERKKREKQMRELRKRK